MQNFKLQIKINHGWILLPVGVSAVGGGGGAVGASAVGTVAWIEGKRKGKERKREQKKKVLEQCEQFLKVFFQTATKLREIKENSEGGSGSRVLTTEGLGAVLGTVAAFIIENEK